MTLSFITILVISGCGLPVYSLGDQPTDRTNQGGITSLPTPTSTLTVVPTATATSVTQAGLPISELLASDFWGILPDYLPVEVGTTWRYSIAVGPAEPLYYQEIEWPVEAGGMATQRKRGLFFEVVKQGSLDGLYSLELQVKRVAEHQGPLQYPLGVELEVLEDTLGVFQDHKEVYLAIDPHPVFEATLLTMFPSYMNIDGYEEGFSRRFIFGHRIGEESGLMAPGTDNAPDTLLFNGIVITVPGSQEFICPCLHFVRTVTPNELKEGESPNYLDNGFREDLWYAKGKGLVRLIQTIEGQTAMTWTLESFSAGSGS